VIDMIGEGDFSHAGGDRGFALLRHRNLAIDRKFGVNVVIEHAQPPARR